MLPYVKKTSSTFDIEKNIIYKKYANKSSPLDIKRTRSSLLPYTGIWDERKKVHLIKRTMFGVKPTTMSAIQSLTMSQTVNLLLNTPLVTPPPPINYYENIEPDTQNIPFGQTWVNTPYDNIGTVSYYRFLSTQSWWIHNILNQNNSIQQKMVLFWHNHIATQNIGENRAYYEYLKLLNVNRLGNFKSFVKDITKNAMMLVYLNGQ